MGDFESNENTEQTKDDEEYCRDVLVVVHIRKDDRTK